jgi:2'-5' RNA ligase
MINGESYGCLMCYVSKDVTPKLIEVGEKLVKDSQLYTEPNEDYGRETEPHVTIKYGFSPDLTDDEVEKMLIGVKKFTVTASGISTFSPEKFDVVKFDVVPSGQLLSLRKMADKFPNKDEHPNFHPHITISYVKKGSFPREVSGKNIVLTIDRMVYSTSKNVKTEYKLL